MYVNVNKVHAFLNLFSDKNRLSDVKDLWDIFLMTKKKPLSKILGCYLALPFGYIFFSQKYRLAAGC